MPLQQKSVTLLSKDQILNLASSGVQLVPAPGIKKIVLPEVILLDYKFGTAPYVVASRDDDVFGFGPGTPSSSTSLGWGCLAQGFIDALTDQVVAAFPFFLATRGQNAFTPVNVSLPLSKSLAENLPFVVFNNGSNWTGGDGTVTITVLYTIVDLS